jgi:3-isopropylmalate dehydratase small subunit
MEIDWRLFYDRRYTLGGKLKSEFPLNKPEAHGAQILVAGDNFGCGSSRVPQQEAAIAAYEETRVASVNTLG